VPRTDNPTGRPGTAGDYRGRPVWWAVLAVALGLMALVAAMSFAGRTGPTRAADAGHERRATPASTAVAPPTGGRPAQPLPTTVSTTAPMTPPLGTGTSAAAPPTTAPSTPRGTVRPTTGSTLGPTGGTGGSPVTTVTSPADSSTTSPAEMTTTTTVPAVQTFAGYLAYPDDVSATYQTGGGGTVSATATWTGTPTLSLTITCTSQHVSRNGESGISLAVTDDYSAGVPCNVTLAEPPSEEGTVSYSLSVSLASS
jgi:hypothetical protein